MSFFPQYLYRPLNNLEITPALKQYQNFRISCVSKSYQLLFLNTPSRKLTTQITLLPRILILAIFSSARRLIDWLNVYKFFPFGV